MVVRTIRVLLSARYMCWSMVTLWRGGPGLVARVQVQWKVRPVAAPRAVPTTSLAVAWNWLLPRRRMCHWRTVSVAPTWRRWVMRRASGPSGVGSVVVVTMAVGWPSRFSRTPQEEVGADQKVTGSKAEVMAAKASEEKGLAQAVRKRKRRR